MLSVMDWGFRVNYSTFIRLKDPAYVDSIIVVKWF